MKKILILAVSAILLFTSTLVSFADTADYGTKEKIIEAILEFSKTTYEEAPRQEGKKATGLSATGTVYTVYPEVTKEIRDKLSKENIGKIESMLNGFSKEELVLGFDGYKDKLKNQARYRWLPQYQEPQYVELAYYENALAEDFKFAIARHEAIIKEAKEKEALENYSKTRVEGMPSVWAKQDIDEAIAKGYVPAGLQSNYQNPITREEFAEIFVTTVFTDFRESNAEYKPVSNEAWNVNKSIVDNFIDKIATTEYFTDTENKYVKAANMLGIVNGSGNHIFNPSNLITREQAAVMLVNYYQSILVAKSARAQEEFEDYNEFSSWAQKSVSVAYESQIIKGSREMKHDGYSIIEKGYFDAKGNLTREQAILIISRASKVNSTKNVLYLRGTVGSKIEQLAAGCKIDGDSVVMNDIVVIASADEDSNSDTEKAKNDDTMSTETSTPSTGIVSDKYYDAERTTINEDEIKAYKSSVIELVNVERAKADKGALVYNEELEIYAQMRAQDMADRDYFSHDAPDGKGYLDLIVETNKDFYRTFRNSGENILLGSIHTTPDGSMKSWMGSRGHKMNILLTSYKTMAVGYAYNAETGKCYWVQLFID